MACPQCVLCSEVLLDYTYVSIAAIKLLYLHGVVVRPTDDILLHAEHS